MMMLCSAAEAHPVPGGVFPTPPAATDLLLKLPPPQCFNVSHHRWIRWTAFA